MLSSEGKFTDNEETKPQIRGDSETNTLQKPLGECEYIFSLIDRLLSLEACLYHQILPLELKGDQLLLGMVNPQDSEALNYVSRILSSINYTMVIKLIPAKIHQATLSGYLNYKNTCPPDATSTHQPSKNQAVPLSDQLNPSASTYAELDGQPNLIDKQTTKEVIISNLNVLPIEIPERLSPIEVLPTLPPKKLLEELLGRILLGGIGRLYLERQPDQGRILWSDNGVLQSIIENLPISVFCEVINEFKQFTGLPVATLTEPKQVEKEWQYQNNSLLLRLRVMPGIHGEEATLQVLRGAALKFYQQQQLNRLSRDTLVMTQQLSFKLHELEQRLQLNPNLQSEQLKAVAALTQLVDNLDKQLNVLTGDK